MQPLWLVLRKDLLRRVRSPLAPIVFLIFPIAFALLIGVTFGPRGEEIAPIGLAIVDADSGLVARAARMAFREDGEGPRFRVAQVDSALAVRMVERDKVAAALWIPKGFTDDLLDGRSTGLRVLKNPAQPIYAEIAEEYVNVLALLGSGAMRVLGEPIAKIRDAARAAGPPSPGLVSQIAVRMNERMTGVGRYVFPPAIRLEAAADTTRRRGAAAEASTPFQVALYVLPGMSIFALMSLALISLSDLHRERILGTLARQIASPIPMRAVLLGKALATWVLAVACVAVLAFVAFFWLRRSVSVAGFLALSLTFALTATAFAAAIHSLTRSERTSATIGSIVIMVMAMLGGAWIPLEALPASIRSISPYTLTYWGTTGYRALLFDGAGVAQIAPNIGVLLGLAMVFCVVAIVRMRATHAGR